MGTGPKGHWSEFRKLSWHWCRQTLARKVLTLHFGKMDEHVVVSVGIAEVGGLTPQFTSTSIASHFSVKICAKFQTLRYLTTSSLSVISSLKEG